MKSHKTTRKNKSYTVLNDQRFQREKKKRQKTKTLKVIYCHILFWLLAPWGVLLILEIVWSLCFLIWWCLIKMFFTQLCSNYLKYLYLGMKEKQMFHVFIFFFTKCINFSTIYIKTQSKRFFYVPKNLKTQTNVVFIFQNKTSNMCKIKIWRYFTLEIIRDIIVEIPQPVYSEEKSP